MLLEDFLEAAESYDSLGWAVQEQLRDLMAGYPEPHDLNENAVTMIAQFADTLYSNYGIDTNELHSAIDRYEEECAIVEAEEELAEA